MGVKSLSRKLSGQNLGILVTQCGTQVGSGILIVTTHKGAATRLFPTICPPVAQLKCGFRIK